MTKKFFLPKNLLTILLVLVTNATILKKTTYAKNTRPVPEPYVECNNTEKPEWHSLRPYQASPCQIPINNEEQSLLCGKDFVIRQTFNINSSDSNCICTYPSQTNDNTTTEIPCQCKVSKKVETNINTFDSELPILGNTELINYPNPSSVLDERKRLQDWKDNKPPDPSQFEGFQDYYKAYQRWRGKSCVSVPIPIINKEVMLCYNNPTKFDFWGSLFPYIPYSSTEDRIGKISSSDFSARGLTNLKIENLKTEWKNKSQDDPRNKNTSNNESVLFFPHMTESVELLTLLQPTFVAKENLNNPDAQRIKSEDIEEVPKDNFCQILETRQNPGDQLFGEQLKNKSEKSEGAPAAIITYDAIAECPAVWKCENTEGKSSCRIEHQNCTHTVELRAPIQTFTPLAEEIWSKSVAGNSSVFRKIYPKITTGSVYEKLKDIPTSTNVEYSVTDKNGESTLANTTPKLYFAHIGGVYEYFLKGIQTALRPKDFPGLPANLESNQPIPENDLPNEYLSWYLNGTIYRPEEPMLSHKDKEDIKKIINLSGPINKLLPQEIQWRNKIQTNTLTSYRSSEQKTGRVNTIDKAETERHNQIAACLQQLSFTIPIIGKRVDIGGFPMPCNTESFLSTRKISQDENKTNTCPDVSDSEIDSKYLGKTKENFIRMANTYSNCHLADKCYNYVVKKSLEEGVNPILSLTLWLHESGASSYCNYPGVEDFGIHYIAGEDIIRQLDEWLKIGKTGAACNWCYNKYPSVWKEPMQAFLYVYKYGAGDCNPFGNQGFYENMKKMFQWVCDPIASCITEDDRFKISCSNDTSYP